GRGGAALNRRRCVPNGCQARFFRFRSRSRACDSSPMHALSRRFLPTAVALGLVLAGAGTARAGAVDPAPYDGYVSPIYSDHANWLCRGDTDDVCDHDMDATIVKGSGRTRPEKFREAEDPKIDCFYVYPTISTDPG